jgi:hypothetical protein
MTATRNMAYADTAQLEGLLADACLRHGIRNPYAGFGLIPERQHRLQAYARAIEAYEKAIQGAYSTVAVAHHDRYHEIVALDWLRAGRTYDLDRLEEAATSGNEVAFAQILAEIDWNSRSAEDHIRAIDLALQVGAHLAARKLAAQGAEFHRDSEELQKYARILAPPQVVRTQPRRVDVLANIEWLKANQSEYKGKWVAIKEGALIASADSHDQLIAVIGETKGRSILVTNL